VLSVIEDYGLRFAKIGPYANRIIFPVTYRKNLVTWTGRTIDPRNQVRYRTLSLDADKAKQEGLPQALKRTTDLLWNFDDLRLARAALLVVCEGPFDAMRVDFLGRKYGIRGTCLFTKNISPDQVRLLAELSTNYQRGLILLDADASMDILRMSSEIEPLGFEFHTTDQKDPALMQEDQIKALLARKGRSTLTNTR
jgi:hypothetical protein